MKRPNRTPLKAELQRRDRQRREASTDRAEAHAHGQRSARNDLLPGLRLDVVPICELKAARCRVRKADEAQIIRIAASLREFGVCRPILITGEHRIIDGHLVAEAATRVGLEHVTCITIDHLDEAQQRLLTLSINRLQERGEWDFGALSVEMQDLILLDQPIEVSGFSAPEIDQILIGEEEDALETAALEPEPHAVCVSERGDLWRLGDHRLLCGDATDARSFERVLMGSVARLVLTDVPFNVPIARHVTSRPHREFVQASGEMTEDEFYRFNLAWIQVAKAGLPDGGLLATFIDWRSVGLILRLGSDLDLPLLNLIVWAKTNAGMGSLWRSQHELLPVFKVGSGRHLNNIELGRHGRHRSNVWTYPGASSLGSDSRRGLKIHPAVKPVAMLRDMILDVTHRGDVVLDPFLGSGSTLMAAQDCGRRACGIELDPLYVDVAVRRWEASTGLSAVLEATGETFSEIQSRCPRDAGRFPPSSPQLRLPSPPSKET